MKTTLIHSFALLLFLPVFTGCMNPDVKLHDTTNEIINEHQHQVSVNENTQYLAEMENYKEKVLRNIEANDKEILEIRKALVRRGEVIPMETMEILKQLDHQNLGMKIKMNDYTGDGMESWRAFKAEFGSDMTTLSNSIRTLKSSYSIH